MAAFVSYTFSSSQADPRTISVTFLLTRSVPLCSSCVPELLHFNMFTDGTLFNESRHLTWKGVWNVAQCLSDENDSTLLKRNIPWLNFLKIRHAVVSKISMIQDKRQASEVHQRGQDLQIMEASPGVSNGIAAVHGWGTGAA